MIELNKLYKHYKGTVYRTIFFAKDSETGKDVVIYQNPENFQIWVRPIDMWEEVVDDNGTKRFTLIEEE